MEAWFCFFPARFSDGTDVLGRVLVKLGPWFYVHSSPDDFLNRMGKNRRGYSGISHRVPGLFRQPSFLSLHASAFYLFLCRISSVPCLPWGCSLSDLSPMAGIRFSPVILQDPWPLRQAPWNPPYGEFYFPRFLWCRPMEIPFSAKANFITWAPFPRY